ncbi:hypothetical protein [Micromonospora sp. NPDC093277]|uniref:hypothetical protein n=1 Tax=Micromonospora sp. NPDC093277 TaxID=3364291 RepID=UPI00380E5C21
MPRPLIIDEASTAALVNQFSDTVQDQATARSNLNNLSAELNSHWRSDSASPVYQAGMQAADRALNRINAALQSLADDMQAFRSDTQVAEDDAGSNAQQVQQAFGGNWAVR